MSPFGPMEFCPFSWAMFVASAGLHTYLLKRQIASTDTTCSSKPKKLLDENTNTSTTSSTLPSCQVVFVLGGPGAGKGTQCELLQQNYANWHHLSAGDLLRAARKNGGPIGDLVNRRIAAGQLVPAEITVKLLQAAMQHAHQNFGTRNFLIDGFPRNQDNVQVWQQHMAQHRVPFVIYFDCPEEVLVGRLLERGQTSGRTDDKLEVIRNRFRTFQEESKPIVEWYEQQGLLRTIVSDQSVEQVYQQVRELFDGMEHLEVEDEAAAAAAESSAQ